MRAPQLKIKKFLKNGYTFYGIHVPAFLHTSGKNGYFYYHTRTEAERGRAELARAMTSEKVLHLLSNAQQADALRASELLAQHGVTSTLTDVVETALPMLTSSGRHVTVDALCKAFAEAKAAGWSIASRRNFRNVSGLFLERFGGQVVADVTAPLLQEWLAERFESAGYQAATVRTLRPAFNYAVRQGWLDASPFERLETVRVRRREGVDIFTPEEARRIMDTVPADCKVPFAILLFAGVRPQELTRLTWGAVRDGFIHITPAVAKTGQVRNVEVEPTLAAWLATAPSRAQDDSICPANWKRKYQAARAAAGVAGRQDAARHSYATYYLAKYKNADALKVNLGHSRGSDMLFVHYRAAATPAQAEAYWRILPSA